MHQGIGNLLQYGFVQFGLLAADLELDLLAELGAQVPHQARKAVEGEADGQHADRHDRFLQFVGVARQLVETVAQRFYLAHVEIFVTELAEHGLGDYQLTDQIDESVDLVDADPD